jgi:hypothetical protein
MSLLQSLTAKSAMRAKEKKSLTAKSAMRAKEKKSLTAKSAMVASEKYLNRPQERNAKTTPSVGWLQRCEWARL